MKDIVVLAGGGEGSVLAGSALWITFWSLGY